MSIRPPGFPGTVIPHVNSVLSQPEDVSDAFIFEFVSNRPLHEGLEKCSDYLITTYILEDATYPPETWAWKSVRHALTTSAYESCHAYLKENFQSTHSNIYSFADFLLAHQREVYVKLQSTLIPRVPQAMTRKGVE